VWEDTYRNTVELTQHLLQKYNLDTQQVWRHWDITGKDCPKMMCESEDEAWGRYLNCVKTSTFPDEKQPIASGIVNSEILNIRQGNGTYFPLAGTLAKNDRVNIFEQLGSWYRIGKGQWVSRSLVSAQGVQESGKAGIVRTAKLNVRFGPSTYHPVTGSLVKGDKITIYNQEGDWYHIGDNRWANKNFIISEQESLRKGRVIANSLNIRGGAGNNQAVVGWLKKNDEVSILDERANWLRIGPNQWVHGAYISEIVIKRGRVNTARLNIRTGPGTGFGVAGCLQQNEWVNIEQEEGSWFGIGVDRWVHRDFILLEDFREK
jgi:N-acetylmuramoyl-L-alanine amidase